MKPFAQWLENTGQKQLIIVRGISGSGKSTLAKQLAGTTGKIFSTDDQFMSPEGEYKFDPSLLGKHHQTNQNLAKEAMQQGISPIVIDNTNTTMKEMQPYVLLAKEFGYKVQFQEPTTPWKFDAEELAKRNKHGVPLHVIQRMLQRWETINSEE